MTFQKGQSGNPAGRPLGKAALFAEAMFEGDAEDIIRTANGKAKEGAPRPRDRVIPFELPPLTSAQSALAATAEITAAVARSDLTPLAGRKGVRLIDRYLNTLECVEFEQRVSRLEKQANIRPPETRRYPPEPRPEASGTTEP